MHKTLVTGANGLVGNALIKSSPDIFLGAVRANPTAVQVAVGNIGPETNWQAALAGCNSVIHLAARVHVMRDQVADPLAAFRLVNTRGTLNLARQAAESGVRRFVFLSSIKVNGESTVAHPFSESDPPEPQDPYAISKWEAEQGLWEISKSTGMEVVILRPPLVYGSGVKANFLKLMQWVDKGVPLPLASVDNRRSMIYLGNLVDAIRTCLIHPNAAGQTFLVSDGEDVSTPELIRRLAFAMGRPARMPGLPVKWLQAAGKALGKQDAVDRLVGSLTLDISAIQSELNWNPPYTMEAGLENTVAWYRQHKSRL